MLHSLYEAEVKKWEPVLNEGETIKDAYRRQVTAVLLENQAKDNAQYLAETGNVSGITAAGTDPTGFAKFDPVLIGLVRRAMPNLLAYDVFGVQPMTGPTGLIFAKHARYTNREGEEALFQEANSAFTGDGTQSGTSPADSPYTYGTGMTTPEAEALGGTGTWSTFAFDISKISVVAKTRAIKAGYTVELAQDLKSVHGLSAETELMNDMAAEVLFEQNREAIRTMYVVAQQGAAAGTTATPGTFDLDVDSNGRWSVERFKGLAYQIERECNHIAQTTRRGKGNFIVTSSDVASALAMAGILDYAPALQAQTNLQVDDTGNTYAGNIGKVKVYIDPYSANLGAANQYVVAGYKGANAWDAGLYFAPYVPLQLAKAVDPATMQPIIAFKTRYGIVANPFVKKSDGTPDGDAMTAGRNQYFRRVRVLNLM
jgi:hypothetical protein